MALQPKTKENLFKLISIALGVAISCAVAGAFFILAIRFGFVAANNPLRVWKNKVLMHVLAKPEYKKLVLAAAPKQTDTFFTTWDFNNGVALSKRVYEPTAMFGQPKYRMKANCGIYNARVWSGYQYQSLVLPETPEISGLLETNKVDLSIHFRTDEHGFKPTESGTAGPVIFFLGDSFTEGLWVDSRQTFASIFARRMKSAGQQGRVYNLGVNGYSALESCWMLEHFAPKLHPALVVLNLFPNDVDDDYVKVMKGQVPEESCRNLIHYLERLNDYCRKGGITLVVTSIPPKEQFAEAEQGSSFFQDLVRRWSGREKVVFLDPRETFRTIGPEKIYLDWDPHFSATGHRHYGEFLFKQLGHVLSGNRPGRPEHR